MSDCESNEQNNEQCLENNVLNKNEQQLSNEIEKLFSNLNLENKEESISQIKTYIQEIISNIEKSFEQMNNFHNIYVDCLNSLILGISLDFAKWQNSLNSLLLDATDKEKLNSNEEWQQNISSQITDFQQKIKETKERVDEIVVKETKANEEFKSIINNNKNINSPIEELEPLIQSQQNLYEELQTHVSQSIPKELQFIGSQPIEDKSKLEYTTRKGDMDPIIEESKKENSRRLEEILQKTKPISLAFESFDPIIIESSAINNNNTQNNNNIRPEKRDLTLIIAPLFTIDENQQLNNADNKNNEQNDNQTEEDAPVVTIQIEDTNNNDNDGESDPVVYHESTASSRSLKTSPIHTYAAKGVRPFQFQFYNEDFSILPMRVRKSLDLSSKIVQKGIMPEIRKRLIKESLEYFDTNYPNPNIEMGQTILRDEFPEEYEQYGSISARSTYGYRGFARSLPSPIQPPSSPRGSPQSPRGTLTKRDLLDPCYNSKEIREEIERIRNIKVPHSTPPKMEGPNDDPAARFRKFNEEYAAMLDEKSWRKQMGISQPLTPPTRATLVKNKRESRRIHKPSSPSPRPMGVFFDYRQSQMFQPRIAPE